MYEPDRAQVDEAVEQVLAAHRRGDVDSANSAARALVTLLDCTDVLVPACVECELRNGDHKSGCEYDDRSPYER